MERPPPKGANFRADVPPAVRDLETLWVPVASAVREAFWTLTGAGRAAACCITGAAAGIWMICGRTGAGSAGSAWSTGFGADLGLKTDVIFFTTLDINGLVGCRC